MIDESKGFISPEQPDLDSGPMSDNSPEDTQRAVRQLQALGNRPQDHRDRDLLLASLLRDPRTPLFRKYSLKPPVWVPTVPSSIPKKLHSQARQLLLLASMHANFIRKMRVTVPGAGSETVSGRILEAMDSCMPRGGLFERRGPGDFWHPCGYGRLCPWCHARSVERLYDGLIAGPCKQSRLQGKHLVAIRLRIPSNMSGCQEIALGNAPFADDIVFDGEIGSGQVLHRGQVQAVRERRANWLLKQTGRIGLDGGILIHQIGPYLAQAGMYATDGKERCFLHEFTLLAERTFDSKDEIARFQKLFGMLPDTNPPTLSLDERHCTTLQCVMLPAEHPQALRYLLCGTSYKYPVQRVGLSVSKYSSSEYGIQGAMALQPWFMFTPAQFWSYQTAMQDLRLFDLFGSWRRQRPAGPARRRSFPTQDGRRSKLRRRRAFQQKNNERKNEARDRRDALISIAAPIYTGLNTIGGKSPGSPALRTAMSNAGHVVSDRDARWLVRHFADTDREA